MHFEEGRKLSELTTFKIGGPARFYVEVKEIAHLSQVLSYCHQNHLPTFVLGKGSNLLFSDKGFDGVVIHNKGRGRSTSRFWTGSKL